MAACAHGAARSPTVRRIRFEEQRRAFRWARGTSDVNLRAAIEQPQDPFAALFLPGLREAELHRRTIALDGRRLEVWYAHHGFFDAEFRGWELRSTSRGGRGGLVLVGHVREGPPSTVSSVRIDGLDPADPRWRPLLHRFQRIRELGQGDRFDLDALHDDRDRLLALLQEQSYARAEVDAEARVVAGEHSVVLLYTVRPGPACTFGRVRVSGLDAVPEVFVRDEVVVHPGSAFSKSALATTRLRLLGLGTFSLVQVRPDLGVDGAEIPVEVRLSEARFRELLLGGGLGFQLGEQELRASGRFEHRNVAGRLVSLELEGQGGYRTFSDSLTLGLLDGEPGNALSAGGPFFRLGATLGVPRFPAAVLRSALDGEVERGLDLNARYLREALTPSVTWKATARLSLTGSFHLEHWDGDLDPALLELEQQEHPELAPDRYDLAWLGQRMVWDHRDSRLEPRRGVYAELEAREAGLPLGYRFLAGRWDLRRYFGIVRPLRSVFAVRLAGDVAAPWGAELGYVPAPERFLLGGGSTVRGWSLDHLGPLACPADPAEPCVPTGALRAWFGSAEYRLDLPWDLGIAFFVDAGMGWDDAWFVPAELQRSAGTGLRYRTPVGPARLDLAWRQPCAVAGEWWRPTCREEGFAREPRFAIHFALSEAF